MSEAKNWSDEQPPLNTVIEAHYGDGDWQQYQTCRRGCCVYDMRFGEALVPPLQWRLMVPPRDKES